MGTTTMDEKLHQLNHHTHPVMIMGEKGTGKDQVAASRSIYHPLENYTWPQNYMQLKRVLTDLVLLSQTPYITAPPYGAT